MSAQYLPNTHFKPASAYSREKYPCLDFLTRVRTGAYKKRYFFTDGAARVVEQSPQMLLIHALNNKGDNSLLYKGRPCVVRTNLSGVDQVYSYRRGEQDLCHIQTVRKRLIPGLGPNLSLEEQVFAFTPEESANRQAISLHHKDIDYVYPSFLLPFDLCLLVEQIEKASGTDPELPGTYYVNSNAMDVYGSIHYLMYGHQDLAQRMSKVRKVLEVGCSIGVQSLIISQLLPQAMVTAIDINDVLIGQAEELRVFIRTKRGYDFSNVRFREWDILAPDFPINEYDLVVGFFPLGTSVPNHRLRAVFHGMLPGSLLLEAYTDAPVGRRHGKMEGFREIDVRTGSMPPFCYNVFERE